MDQFFDGDGVRRLKEQVDRSFDTTCYPVPHFSVTEEQIQVIQTQVSGLSLDFGTRKYNDLIKWGSRVCDSEIRLHHPRKTGLYCSSLVRCRLVAVQPQEAPNWINMHWIDCKFEGIFRYCSFGRMFDDRCFHTPLTLLQRCDFSKARLDHCVFLNADPRELTWPSEPHIIVHEPWRHGVAIRSIHPDWPLQGFLQGIALADEELTASAFSLEWLRAERLTPPDLERFVAACRRLDFITTNF